jgi:hypothetical protein
MILKTFVECYRSGYSIKYPIANEKANHLNCGWLSEMQKNNF